MLTFESKNICILKFNTYLKSEIKSLVGFTDDRHIRHKISEQDGHRNYKMFEKKKESKTTQLSKDFKSALRHFAYYYTNGTLQYVIGDENLLKGVDYREDLKTEASLV